VTKLGRCEALRAFDETGRFAAIDGRLLCTDYDLPAPIREPPVSSRVVDLSTGRTVLDLGDAPLFGARFGPPLDDGRPGLFTLVNPVARSVTVYYLSTGDEVGSYVPDDEGSSPGNVAMASDGRRLAVTTTDGKLTVIDLAALARGDDAADAIAWTVTAHGGSIQALAVSENGTIATGSSSGEYRVWSPDGKLVAELRVELDDPPSLAFVPGTDTLYYEDGAGVYRRFVGAEETARLAKALLTRGFTDDECNRYFPNERCPTFSQ
jgi:hypothetical protein